MLSVSVRVLRSVELAAAILGCRTPVSMQGTYTLQTIDGSPPPVTMFTDLDNQSQLITATITIDSANRAIYVWQYRVLHPDARADTLQLGIDTFSIASVHDQIVLSRYRQAGFDSPDSVLQADTAQLLGEVLVLRDRNILERTVLEHILRFARK